MANIAAPHESGSLVNLWLPQAAQGGAGKTQKVWVGDGFPSIPKKVHDRIIAWEYVDLGDLRQAGTWEALNPEPDPQQVVILQGIEVARAKRKPVKDIYTWIQCFAIYMAAMAKHDPGSIPEMLAYMLTIMKTQKEFKEPAWRLYDEAYREKSAATGNRRWSQINPLLYNQLFTGRAIEVAFCQHYHSTTHTGDTCKEAPPRKKKQPLREIAPSIADGTLHAHTHQVQCAGCTTRATVPFSQTATFATFAQPANAPTPLFTALEHLGEGPRAQGQQPRRERKQGTQRPVCNCDWLDRIPPLGRIPRCDRLVVSPLLLCVL